jgi:c-di-GMP-binding flagellar brake protein YcgR
MIRIGIRFLDLSPSEQSTLDRLLFLLLQLESRSRRHLRGGLLGGGRPAREQRRQHRAPAPTTVRVLCRRAESQRQLDPTAQARVLAGATLSPCCEATLLDLSGAGCAMLCPADRAPPEHEVVELEIAADDLRLRVQGTVIHAQPARGRRREAGGSGR